VFRSTTYNTLEARNQLSKLIDAAEAGEEVIIARRGKPVVRLVAIDSEPSIGSPEALAKVFAKWEGRWPERTQEELDEEKRELKSGWREDR
jgi:prevent-host-death family protein